eukprot:458180_1
MLYNYISCFALINTFFCCLSVRPTWYWDWDHIQPFNFGVNQTGYDNQTELQFKSNFPILLVDCGVNNGISANSSSCCPGINCSFDCAYESFQIEQAKQYKQSISSTIPVFTYWSAFYLAFPQSYAGRIYNNSNYKHMFLGGGLYNTNAYNFSNETAVDWFVNEQIKAVASSPYVDGIYLDSGNAYACNANTTNPPLTYNERQILFNATVKAWAKAAQYLTGNNKYLTISLRNHFSNITVDNSPFDCPYGEEVYYELMNGTNWIPFRQYNIPSKDYGKDGIGCCAAINDVSYMADYGATFVCCNDASMSFDNGTHFNTSLAAFLMGMEKYSYFGAGFKWDDNGWNYWWPEFSYKLGKPKGKFTQNGFKFTREFQHASVFIDCESLESNVEWR